ncbi:hypothetical protein KKB84_02650 [bacterium]|nr:hypothetical protein [bacterium]MBU1152855.1 hypothetical protein [bacterium]MBU1782257.1 hypothetical protein [bacterium]MBU2600195.1 hypothetical protein [bacterium]
MTFIKIIAFLFFIFALFRLLISLKNEEIISYEEWKYFKGSLVTFIIWGGISFGGTILSYTFKEGIFYAYLLSIEYFVALIGVILLFRGVYKIYLK